MTTTYGFRIVGPCTNERRLVDWQAAFVGYASCDARAEVSSEAYLSAFTFGDDFRRHLEANGSPKGFDGICGAEFIWFDIDRSDLEVARRDAARLALFVTERYSIDEAKLLIFFSGSKGFHLGTPTTLFGARASPVFHRVARRLAEAMATAAKVEIDVGVYDKVRAFRAPNSLHPKAKLYKRAVDLDRLTKLSAERLQELAQGPVPFDLPLCPPPCHLAVTDWEEASQQVHADVQAARERLAVGDGAAKLNRSTLDFIRNGAGTGDRHRLLFSAAANLAEFGCPPELAHELLTEAALDLGLRPSDTRRQIECGLNHTRKGTES